MTKNEAIKKVMNFRDGMKVISVIEQEAFFIVNTVPIDYDENIHGMFIGGGILVDKNTGECRLYNPMRDGFIKTE